MLWGYLRCSVWVAETPDSSAHLSSQLHLGEVGCGGSFSTMVTGKCYRSRLNLSFCCLSRLKVMKKMVWIYYIIESIKLASVIHWQHKTPKGWSCSIWPLLSDVAKKLSPGDPGKSPPVCLLFHFHLTPSGKHGISRRCLRIRLVCQLRLSVTPVRWMQDFNKN